MSEDKAGRRIRTDAAVRAAKPVDGRQVEYRVDGLRGLALRVSPAGGKTWTLRYRTAEGHQRRQTIGTYPEVGLADARSAAQVVLGGVAAGRDPAKEKRTAKAAATARRMHTVSDLLDAYFEDCETGRHRPNARAKRPSTLAMERGYADRFIRPKFGRMPVADVSRREAQRMIADIEGRSVAVARITRNVLRQAFNYAIRQEAVATNPVQLVHVAHEPSRERVLSDDELRRIWRVAKDPDAVEGLAVARATGLALCLALVTLQRGDEVTGIHARELDREARTWTIPGARVKNHRTHVVPLSDLACDLLDSAFRLAGCAAGKWSGYAFPSPRDDKRPMERRSMSRGLAKMRTSAKIADATPHDFRRTGSTNLTTERLGFPRFIVSRVLNQVSDTGGASVVTGVYDRNEYLPEKRRALDAWAMFLTEVVEGREAPTNVVALRAG